MTQDRIERDIVIEAPIDLVWQTITEPEHLNGWFTDESEVDLSPGGAGVMKWGARATKEDKQPDETFSVPIRIEVADRPYRFAFRWGYQPGDEPTLQNSLLVEFTLAADGESTRVKVVESGVRDLGWNDDAKVTYIKEHEVGWDKHMADLGAYAAKFATGQA